MPTLEVQDTEFEYAQRGSGESLVFVHGSASDLRSGEVQLGRVASAFRCLAYSRRYHWPNTPIPENADYSMVQHVDDLQDVLRAREMCPAHLVGHSYGALVCLLLALRDPGLVRTLVLSEPPAIRLFVSNQPKTLELLRLAFTRPRTAVAVMRFGAAGMAPATRAARRGDLEEAMRIFGVAVLGKEYYRRLSATRREQVAANAIRAEFLGSGMAPLDPAALRRLEIPTLLVEGMDSPAVFHRLGERLEELLPRCERVVIPGASHIVHEDAPDAFHDVVRSFLARHAGS